MRFLLSIRTVNEELVQFGSEVIELVGGSFRQLLRYSLDL